MNGEMHILVADLALACVNKTCRMILVPRWGGIEIGATLSDDDRIMWERIEPTGPKKQLVHRCYIDSEDPKDHGCVTRALSHAEGSLGFVELYLRGELGDAYPTEEAFLENLGLFLGIASHHIADLCTPVHVGHRINYKALGYKSYARVHQKVERDLGRAAHSATITLHRPQLVDITAEYFWGIAQDAYERHFSRLADLYERRDTQAIERMTDAVLGTAMRHTADVWFTVLKSSGMTDRRWTQAPLV